MLDHDKLDRYAKRIPLFNGLSPEEISDILHKGEIFYIAQGKTIFHQGQLGNALFIVLSGTVDIYNEDHRIAQCRVGDAFGEMSVLDHRPHTASAVAGTEVKLFTLAEGQLSEILHQRVAVRLLLNVIHVLSGHVADSNTKLAYLERKLAQHITSEVHSLSRSAGSSDE